MILVQPQLLLGLLKHALNPVSFLRLRPGDALRVMAHPNRERVAADGPAAIGCTLPEALAGVKTGEQIWFDDGKIEGVVAAVDGGTLTVRITQARAGGEKLRNDKGINLPDTHLTLPALTAKDLQDLAFIAQHVDIVALSFVNCFADVELLRQHQARLTDRELLIVLKIEMKRGCDELPALLLGAMQAGSCGVMIARGDLAVECGFERLAEVQEKCSGCARRPTCPSSGPRRCSKAWPAAGYLPAPILPIPPWVTGPNA